MKFLACLLAITMLALSAIPCSDGQNLKNQQYEEMHAAHNHQEESGDCCPVTCICNCCGASITFTSLTTLVLFYFSRVPTQLITTYQSNYRFDFYFGIWQPPQV
ncbi:hypothetical protein BWZ22_11585 [Seonamhaeicola sp. S2-3]|uniref:DUF6660 family protein n=1 Tax=Seonamhaeicola sp. S2-3 TaxID=1936081 RepID=UPI000972949D|nr:DUF6660 family protein [Seonamhaeicola sp. S2-3]APY11835.1 hypothetical protein BWZ22_11585 [Seonamhaeicola sp. S2-3]